MSRGACADEAATKCTLNGVVQDAAIGEMEIVGGLVSINDTWTSRAKVDVLPDGTTLEAAARGRVMLEVDQAVAAKRVGAVVAPWAASSPSTRLVARWQRFDY